MGAVTSRPSGQKECAVSRRAQGIRLEELEGRMLLARALGPELPVAPDASSTGDDGDLPSVLVGYESKSQVSSDAPSDPSSDAAPPSDADAASTSQVVVGAETSPEESDTAAPESTSSPAPTDSGELDSGTKSEPSIDPYPSDGETGDSKGDLNQPADEPSSKIYEEPVVESSSSSGGSGTSNKSRDLSYDTVDEKPSDTDVSSQNTDGNDGTYQSDAKLTPKSTDQRDEEPVRETDEAVVDEKPTIKPVADTTVESQEEARVKETEPATEPVNDSKSESDKGRCEELARSADAQAADDPADCRDTASEESADAADYAAVYATSGDREHAAAADSSESGGSKDPDSMLSEQSMQVGSKTEHGSDPDTEAATMGAGGDDASAGAAGNDLLGDGTASDAGTGSNEGTDTPNGYHLVTAGVIAATLSPQLSRFMAGTTPNPHETGAASTSQTGLVPRPRRDDPRKATRRRTKDRPDPKAEPDEAASRSTQLGISRSMRQPHANDAAAASETPDLDSYDAAILAEISECAALRREDEPTGRSDSWRGLAPALDAGALAALVTWLARERANSTSRRPRPLEPALPEYRGTTVAAS